MEIKIFVILIFIFAINSVDAGAKLSLNNNVSKNSQVVNLISFTQVVKLIKDYVKISNPEKYINE